MENKMINSVKNMALGVAIGAAALTAGAIINDNRVEAKRTIRKMKRTGEKLAKAGESYVKDIIE